MRLLHLSDLHLGKRVNEFSMIEDQKYILNEVLQIIEVHQVEGVLLAGDIYDKSVPSVEAVQIFDEFLTSLAERNLPVFLISGNHDNAVRMSFGGRLFDKQGIYVAPVYEGGLHQITVQDMYGPVHICLLPFLKPALVRHFFTEEEIAPFCKEDTLTYDGAVRAALSRTTVNQAERNILVAHQFVTGAMRCESEEISVGGVDQVEADAFAAYDYVALGHLHGPQRVTRETIRYCGTPLKYSFSEANHKKSVTIVELKEKGTITITPILLKPLHDMRQIRGSYMEVTALSFYQHTDREDYLQVTLTDEEDIPGVIGKLRSIYPNLMRLEYDNLRTRTGIRIMGDEQMEKKSPGQLFAEFYEQQNNRTMSEEQAGYIDKLIKSIREDGE